MPPTKKYRFDPGIQETMERLPVPFAVYQFIDGQVITLYRSESLRSMAIRCGLYEAILLTGSF